MGQVFVSILRPGKSAIENLNFRSTQEILHCTKGTVLVSFTVPVCECYRKFNFRSTQEVLNCTNGTGVTILLQYLFVNAIGNLIFGQLKKSYTVLMGQVLDSFTVHVWECYRKFNFWSTQEVLNPISGRNVRVSSMLHSKRNFSDKPVILTLN